MHTAIRINITRKDPASGSGNKNCCRQIPSSTICSNYREINRRIIYAMPVNHEFDLVEVKVNELASVVDVFVVLESNVTAAGKRR